MNRFALLRNQLSNSDRLCLQMLHYGIGGSARAVEKAAQRGPMEGHLQVLEALGLVGYDSAKGWSITWLGAGVDNWHQQLRQLGDDQAQPRENENGDQVGSPCNDFRQFISGRCWCGRFREDHGSELPLVASEMLAWHCQAQPVL